MAAGDKINVILVNRLQIYDLDAILQPLHCNGVR